jgi:hypothetical protein
MWSIVAFVGVLAVCGLMLWGSYKIEPHWVSKDGQRLVCYAQGISNRGEPYGRWREVRVTQMADGTVEVRPRHGTMLKDRHADGASFARMAGVGGMITSKAQRVSYWRVNGASPDPPPRRVVYLLDGNHDAGMPELIALRVPTKSRALPMLEGLASNKSAFVSELIASKVTREPSRGT